ncbi:sigma-E factor negative regulatory protein [Paraburkholderia rhizosphaerae]|uniref:RseA-like anti sigma(E) protein n=1 Tax=Paraburkholderia rhizosphaerae TaxID=480658 RepID=A0A4R8LQW4_9BURK|nr:sigma-E factor negative regulatory protein [Paraburkholderia rhizosphaerae]TDY47754.1 RseA-like anti sigma(E) protein [Paraburkholderia rhizosphaerae]
MGSVSMRSEANLQASSRGERLSALIDGEWVGEESEAFIGALDREDRATWSDYHLIGDVLRSDDLALSASASHAFVSGFAARFESEAHIVAPSSSSALREQRNASGRLLGRPLGRRLLPAFAVAAAAATLTWIVVPQLQGVNTGMQGAQVASVSSGDTLQRVAMASMPVATAQPAVQDANIIRDASLDQYLEAHQQFAQQPVMGTAMPLIRAAATTQGR